MRQTAVVGLLALVTLVCAAEALLVNHDKLSTIKFNTDLVNKDVQRTINIETHVEEVSVSVEVENTGSVAATEYVIAVPADKLKYLSVLEVTERKRTLTPVPTLLQNPPAATLPGTTFFVVTLHKPLESKSTTNLQISLVFIHTLTPLPAEITQEDAQRVLYTDNHFFLSPYSSNKQLTTVRLASDKIESRSTDEKPNKATRSRVEYGPYNNVPAFKYSKLSIHYENNFPFVTVTNLRRDIEVSHWGNVAVEEHYDLKHTGARLTGPFHRIDYQRSRATSGRSSFRTITAVLPEGASDIYYRDQIGNISTSRVIPEANGVKLEVDPRFPMFGGWKTDFYIGYNLAAHHALSVSKQDPSRFVLNIGFASPFNEAVVNSIQVRVILPEGATDIEYVAPFPVDGESRSFYFTYLDAVGRPVLTLEKTNLVRSHNQKFQVVYTLSPMALLREPFMLITGFLALFAFSMAYMRIEITVDDNEEEQPQKDS